MNMETRKKKHYWTDEQEKYLQSIMSVEGATFQKAAEAVNAEFGIHRTEAACERKHRELSMGVVRRLKHEAYPKAHKKGWKGKHEAYVLENYRRLPIADIAKKLGRTEEAIKNRFNLLMRVKGTSVIVGNIPTYSEDDTTPIKYPDYIPKRWIIKEIKSQYKAEIRTEKQASKLRIKSIKEEMKRKIKEVKE